MHDHCWVKREYIKLVCSAEVRHKLIHAWFSSGGLPSSMYYDHQMEKLYIAGVVVEEYLASDLHVCTILVVDQKPGSRLVVTDGGVSLEPNNPAQTFRADVSELFK